MSDATPAPAITAPVATTIAVADLARSARFYRDVLGFATTTRDDDSRSDLVEMVNGAARLELRRGESAGAATRRVLFLETDDVRAMHAAVAARGGSPSALEDVNWLKQRVFETQDPDGHTLWFGQSYHQPNAEPPRHAWRTIMPELPLDDVPAGVAYYRDALGFSVNYAQDDIGVMDRDDVRVLLVARTPRHTGIGSCYVYVENADAMHAELTERGANVQGTPVSQPWGLREFAVLDLEGNRITLGQPFE
jgi:predicted enzyme related to lactoylglutathione lyase